MNFENDDNQVVDSNADLNFELTTPVIDLIDSSDENDESTISPEVEVKKPPKKTKASPVKTKKIRRKELCPLKYPYNNCPEFYQKDLIKKIKDTLNISNCLSDYGDYYRHSQGKKFNKIPLQELFSLNFPLK